MNKLGDILRSTASTVLEFGKKNAPQILTGLSIAAGIGATAFSIKGTIKAVRLVDKKKAEEKKEKLTVGETVRTVWPCYVPTVALTVVSAFSGLKSLDISQGREAAAIALWKMSETTLAEYKEQTKKVVGEKKEQMIHDEVNKQKASKVLNSSQEVIETGHGKFKFIQNETGQEFRSSKNYIDSVVNKFNKYLYEKQVTTVDLNTILEELGLHRADLAYNITWNADYPIEHYITYLPTPDDNGEPVGYLEFQNYEEQDAPWR